VKYIIASLDKKQKFQLLSYFECSRRSQGALEYVLVLEVLKAELTNFSGAVFQRKNFAIYKN